MRREKLVLKSIEAHLFLKDKEMPPSPAATKRQTKDEKATAKAKSKRVFETALEIAKQSPVKEPAIVAIEGSSGRTALIPIGRIKASPENPRTHFNEEALAELGQSLMEGQVCPLVVRSLPDGDYELIDGERRWRAAQAVGIVSLRAEIRDCTESEAALMRLVSFQREGLSPIEEARGLKLMICKYEVSQRELAAKLNCSQGHVGNRLRLLNLPPDWQDKVISGEITATHARELATWADLPKVLETLAENLEHNDFQEALSLALYEHSEQVEGAVYRDGLSVSLTFTDEQIAAIDVREVRHRWRPEFERRAFNIDLWEDLVNAQFEKRKNKANSKKVKESNTERAKPAKTAADKAKELSSRVAKWKLCWQKRVLAGWFDFDATVGDCFAFFVHASVKNEANWINGAIEPQYKVLFGAKAKSAKQVALFDEVVGLEMEIAKIRKLCSTVFANCELSPWRLITPGLIEHLMVHSKIDLSDAWTTWATRGDDFLESLLKLFQIDQLETLNKEWKLSAVGNTKSALIADMVDRFRQAKKVPAMPAILAKASAKDVTSW